MKNSIFGKPEVFGKFFFAVSMLFTIFALVTIVVAPQTPTWWDTSWHYRAELRIDNSGYARANWPIEQDTNFTELLRQQGLNGTFDTNSIRVVEHNSTGGVMHNLTYQFEAAQNFDAATNAAGTLIFLMNGSTSASATRYFYIYFDVTENGAKPSISYTTRLNYSWDGEEAQINNTYFRWKIDTLRGENTSGIYNVRGYGSQDQPIMQAGVTNPTREYTQYSNGTNNFTFDFRNNATFKAGPLRIILEQNGDEIFWNDPDAKTATGRMTKRYIFYENNSWIKIEQNFTNTGGSAVTRNSTPAGALSVNDLIAMGYGAVLGDFFGNIMNPFSWYGATAGGAYGFGLININQTGTSNYYATNSTEYSCGGNVCYDRIGISLSETSVPAGGSITETLVMQFNSTDYWESMLTELRNEMVYLPTITMSVAESLPYSFEAKANYTIYNRNETVLIFGNTTSDINNVVTAMNATIDMGTPGASDDILLQLYDDGDAFHGDASAGDKIFSNLFNLSEDSATGTWNTTIKAYDPFNVLLNQSWATFNITNIYNATLLIENPEGFVSRLVKANLTVKNYRQDGFIAGATINCSYDSTPVTNISYYGSGIYMINFTAPAVTGTYLLSCNTTKANNTGADAQYFWTETSQTAMTAGTIPANYTTQNISIYSSDSLILTSNATDVGGANARNVNITLSLPNNISSNSTFEQCGLVLMGTSCLKNFNITVANRTLPGNYTLNISAIWQNPDTTINSTNTSFTVYVLANPQIEVPQTNLSGTIGDGNSAVVGNFTVRSFGNANATNITFSVSGLPGFAVAFVPPNISYIEPDTNRSVSVNVSVPPDTSPGNYSGTINISAQNDGWDTVDLNITIPATTNMSLKLSPASYTSSTILVNASDTFILTANVTDTAIANARAVNITLSLPNNISSNSTFEQCGLVLMGTSCLKNFNITVANRTLPGNYTLNISAIWQNPDTTINSTNTSFTVYVLANPQIEVIESNLSAVIRDGNSSIVGNLTVRSFGNVNATNIGFNISGLGNFTIIFSPTSIALLSPDTNTSVSVNVSIPATYPFGNYSGTINISAQNDGWDAVVLNITVPRRLEWNATPTFCEKAESPPEGKVCDVFVNNTGNDILNFTITPTGITNYTQANETSFTVPRNSTHVFAILYNVSGVTKDYFTAFYNITVVQNDTNANYTGLEISLIPQIMPVLTVYVQPQEAEQTVSIGIFANVTDKSGTGINYTELNVTLPNGTIEKFNMTRIAIAGTLSQWYFNYSGNMSAYNYTNYTGRTFLRGTYFVNISSRDNAGVDGSSSSMFLIYAKLVPRLSLWNSAYKVHAGDMLWMNYSLADGFENPLAGANVSFNLFDVSQNLLQRIPASGSITTELDGRFWPPAIFTLASNALVGKYNLTGNTSYFDSASNRTLSSFKVTSFEVYSGAGGGGGGMDADIQTYTRWFPQSIIRFDMLFYLYGNATDPDGFTLAVNHSLTGFSVFNINENSSGVIKVGDGHYIYTYASNPLLADENYPYIATLIGKKEGYTIPRVEYFKIEAPGDFDLGVRPLQSEVVRGTQDFDFEVTMINFGELDQDIFLEYWVTGSDGKIYDRRNEAIQTPAGGVSVVKNRSVSVYSDHPLGISMLTVQMNYSTIRPPITATTTFNVVDQPEGPPPGAEEGWMEYWRKMLGIGGGGPGTGEGKTTGKVTKIVQEQIIEEGALGVAILNYPRQINVVRGWTDIQSVEVRNNGDITLGEITLEVTGIPPSWVSITPDAARDVPSGNSTIFILEFRVPKTADAGEYGYTIIARGADTSDEKSGKLTVFLTMEELVKNDIRRLKVELQQLEEDTDFAAKLGKDVRKVRDVIDDIRTEIGLAEKNSARGDFDNALANVQTASNLLKRGRQLLEEAEALGAVQQPLPVWLVGLIVLLLAIILAGSALAILKSRGKIIFGVHAIAKQGKEKGGEEARREELAAEKEKIERMAALLSQELKDGTITKSVYDELKKRNDEKLAKIAQEQKKP